MWTFRANQESYETPKTELFKIRELYEEQVEQRTPEQVDTFHHEASRRREIMWEKWTQLQIWLDEPMMQNLSQWGSDYSCFFLDQTRMPAAYFAVEQQRRCRLLRDAVITLYKDPGSDEANARRWMPVWILPMFDTKSTGEILQSWGRHDIIDELSQKASGLCPSEKANAASAFQARRPAKSGAVTQL
ncbi:hypothetical protein [Rhizobium sp.]|uniref:hypothetical protein n=1 Tax=Rhizobium sp. TaxID=391 RepID=UPI0028AB5F29